MRIIEPANPEQELFYVRRSNMGVTQSTIFRENFPSKPTFSVDDIPDLTGKVIIVTGANTGTNLVRISSASMLIALQ